jgi:hypothetical protein
VGAGPALCCRAVGGMAAALGAVAALRPPPTTSSSSSSCLDVTRGRDGCRVYLAPRERWPAFPRDTRPLVYYGYADDMRCIHGSAAITRCRLLGSSDVTGLVPTSHESLVMKGSPVRVRAPAALSRVVSLRAASRIFPPGRISCRVALRRASEEEGSGLA